MLNPADIVNALVTALQGTPAVVTELNGDATLIYAYTDSPPQSSSLALNIYQMPAPGVMIAWNGTGPAKNDTLGLFSHEIAIYVRAQDSTAAPGTPTFANIVSAIINAQPTGYSERLINSELLPELLPMEIPTVRRIHDEEGTIDLFEIATDFTEKTDNNGCDN